MDDWGGDWGGGGGWDGGWGGGGDHVTIVNEVYDGGYHDGGGDMLMGLGTGLLLGSLMSGGHEHRPYYADAHEGREEPRAPAKVCAPFDELDPLSPCITSMPSHVSTAVGGDSL